MRAALFAGLFLSFLWMIPLVPARAAQAVPEPLTVIGSPEALEAFSQSVRGGQTYQGRTVTLTADIDMAGRVFPAVGVTDGEDFSRVFQGTFDGDGHAIANLTVLAADGSDGAGFFSGLYGASVQDLTLDVTLSANGVAAAGGLAGRTVDAHISRVDMTVRLTAANWPAPRDGILAAGGLVGLAEGRTDADRCAVRGSLGAAGSFAGTVYAGGLAGCVRSGGADGRVTNCYATAGLYVNDRAVYVGGLAGGFVGDGGYSVVQNCYAASSMIIAGDHMAGGFFGAADGSVLAQNTWYDADLAAGLPSGGNAPLAGLTGAGTSQMCSRGFPAVLGDAFAPDSGGVNGGYPILDFQAPPEPTAAPLPSDTPGPTGTPPAPTAPAATPADASPSPPAAPTGTPFVPTSPPAVTSQPAATSPPIPKSAPTSPPALYAPQTGDRGALVPWLAVLAGCGAALAWMAGRRRR